MLESRKGEMSHLVMFIAFWNTSGGWSRTYRCLRVSVWSKLSTLISFCACDCLWFVHVCPWDCSDTSPETCWSVVTRYSHTSSCFSCSGVCKMILFWWHSFDDFTVLSSQLASQSLNGTDMPDSSPCRYPTHILSDNHYHANRIGEAIGTRKSLEFTCIHSLDMPLLLCSQRAPKSLDDTDMPESSPCRCEQQVPHTYSVWQPLAYHVYLWNNGLLKIDEIDVYTPCLDISLFLSSQLAPKSFNDTDMPESSPHRYVNLRDENRSNWRLYIRTRHFTVFSPSTCA